MILVIDNYDSFTYNLVQYMGEVTDNCREIVVLRNDQITIQELHTLNPNHIVISPGPCTPNEAGISVDVVQSFAGSVPVLGVCLGHQAIAQAFGGRIIRAKEVVHGKTTTVEHDGKGIFAGVRANFIATRYHSLVVEETTLPPCFEITARSSDGEIMAITHRAYNDVIGLQFHPESILTGVGKQLLSHFLSL